MSQPAGKPSPESEHASILIASLWKWEEINVCCLSHPAHNLLLLWTEQVRWAPSVTVFWLGSQHVSHVPLSSPTQGPVAWSEIQSHSLTEPSIH